ncbi:MAG: tellurite resistance/dicarboxylate transporter TDT family [Rhodobacteraceae bacterium]|uniref:SLAC1 family transporter n=1 Tax=Cypionkella sp. TaxID=2811411 RepID=UPI00132A76A4|nr:tellurium resistance protein [Cypionkella sp.]KAF0170906.1 MAG: tellurite resistance/dicarboxylate transporter TDT family [Paracoccaceae bacterium]MDO8328231.1 tellurium resistance protein [Cypionkella sp.]
MTQAPKIERRPKAFPPPEFPPRKPKLFAKTPPAIFPVVLGLLGLGLTLRKGLAVLGLPGGVVEAASGALLAFWAFATLALLAKIARRPGVVAEDLRVLPGRAGMAASSMSAMLAAAVLVPYAPGLAYGLMALALVAHALLAGLVIWGLWQAPAEQRVVSPVWHVSFAGFIVAGIPALALGQTGLAQGLLWATLPVAALIWGISLAQLIARIPPAPLRPLLAIHLSPAALFCIVAAGLEQPLLAQSFAAFGAVILLALIVAARWLTQTGFSALWGSFTFPLAAYASALIGLGGPVGQAGLVLAVIALGVIPPIAWTVIKLWPTGKLAAKTNAAEA